MYQKLLIFLKEIDYWNKYPSRWYLKDSLKTAKNEEEKIEVLLRDSLILQHLYPNNWLDVIHKAADDPVRFVRENMPEMLR
jgi:hypothetical protein